MFNVTKPELVWIEGRCYRAIEASSQISSFQEYDMYENDFNEDIQDDCDNDDDINVEKIDETRFVASQHVSKPYIGLIIGKKGATKIRIERDTKTEIKIPKHGQTGDVVIYGEQPMNIKSAWRQINTIVISSRLKQKATHFISIPMNCPEIISNFEKFKIDVLRECSAPGIEESVFKKPETLHLTIGVMCLMDNEERLQASKLLNEAKNAILKPKLQGRSPVKIRLKGLAYMNDDPKQIDVLYGCVKEEDSSGIVQEIADAFVDYFYNAGFMPKEFGRDNVKLHVTFMNSKLRTRSAENSKGTSDFRQSREKFDGSEILKKYADYDFGSMELKTVHLSQRHAYGPDGYYEATCVISCND